MVRLVFWFAVLVAITLGVTWLADSPGEISIVVRGVRIETQSIGLAVLALGLLFVTIWIVWGLFKWIIGRPSAFGGFFSRRREKKGRQALSTGLVAIGAGDAVAARKAAVAAARLLPNDPLAQLLSAQSAQQQGDGARVKQVYREMVKAPDTKLLGLRGLFSEARREKNIEAAREIAKEALTENPGASWASNAMLVSYAAEKDWPAVLVLLENQVQAKTIDKETAKRKKAVVLTAQALEAEDSEPEAALDLATKAHKLDPALVPAAIIAGRTNSAVGSLRKATRILEKTWSLSPHPDIAEVYAHARPGDSISDRQVRIKTLLAGYHGGREGDIASAVVALEAQDWAAARHALNPYVNDMPSARICTLMAEIEAAEFGNKGRAREWLARAVHAPRDPVWSAQGFIAPEWMPVSPVSGELGAFEWKVPLQGLAFTEQQRQEGTAPFLIADEPEPVELVMAEADDTQISGLEEAGPAEIMAPEISEPEIITIEPEEVEPPEEEKLEEEKPQAEKIAKDSDKAKDHDDLVEALPVDQDTEQSISAPPSPAPEQDEDQPETIHRLPDDPGPKKPGTEKSEESWFG